MRKFNYSFLEKEAIPSNIASMLLAIERNKNTAHILKEKLPKVFVNLTKIAKVQSVKASNAIEGILTTDKRIESIVNEGTEPLNHNEKEIAGYRDALNIVHNNHDAIDIQLRQILLLHSMLLEYTKSPSKGILKPEDNVIAERYPDGTRRIVFVPTPASETKDAMEQLELAFYEARQNYNINELLLIPCYILDFLCIHPFMDGNGRMSRLLTLLLLYKSEHDIGKYVSLEYIINKNKDSYYRKLQESSTGWAENKNSYWSFIEYFLFILLSAYNELANRYNIIKDKRLSKSERIEETIKTTLGKITKEEIHKIWPDISYNTIELELSNLLKEGKIEKIGSTNGASYYWKTHIANQALETMKKMQEISKQNGNSNMSLVEINEKIRLTRLKKNK